MHLDAVGKYDYDQFIIHYLASTNFCVHYIVESSVWPLSFLPVTDQHSTSEQVHRRCNGNIDVPKCELKIELSNPDLSGELSDNGRKVKFFGYPVHFLQSNNCSYIKMSE